MAMRALLAVALIVAGCGGRSLDRPDGGGGDADSDADADSDSDGDSDGDGGLVSCYGVGVSGCPWRLPYCCLAFPDAMAWCTDDPDEYLRQSTETSDWTCLERVPEASLVPFDCIELADFRSELCPAGFPHCCEYDGGVEVCADHALFGWRCDE